jgi:hypothetical protein
VDELLVTDACTLPTADRPLRVAEFDGLFTDHLVDARWDGDRLRIELAGGDDLLAVVRDLTERESECCSFFDFTVQRVGDSVELVVGVPPAQRAVLDSIAARVVVE